MRVTFNTQAMQYQKFIENGLNNITDSSSKVVNKRSLLTPEQDPIKYVGAYNAQRMTDEITQFKANAQNASSWLTHTDTQMQNLVDLIKKAKNEVALAGTSSESDAESRKALAGEADNLFKSIMGVANSNYLGRYMFGGFKTENKPFTVGENLVSGINSLSGNGGDIQIKSVFTDLPELKDGKYAARVTVENGIGTLRLFDGNGDPIIIDSNGSDQSGKDGNNTSTSLTFEYKPGVIIDTGRGISVKMPESDDQKGVEISFNYKAGSEVNYAGDNGSIMSQIGYNQEIPMNIPGSNIFTQSYKTLQGTRFNSIGGLAATVGTTFTALDKSATSLGDTLKVSGTDHNGNRLGAAAILSPMDTKLDLTEASEDERTLFIGYGDKIYKIIVPQEAYKSIDDLSLAINNRLKKSEYVGSLGDLPKGASVADYKNIINNKIQEGKFPGELTEERREKYYTDLTSEVYMNSDGERLEFVTSKAGDNLRLSVSGLNSNVIGFGGRTLASFGKDTVFNVGFDPHKDTLTQIITSHKDIDLSSGGTKQFYINGDLVNISLPKAEKHEEIIGTNINLSGKSDVVFNIQGKEIIIKKEDLTTAKSTKEKTVLFNKALGKAGLSGTAQIGLSHKSGGKFNINLTYLNVSKKDYEIAFDKSLRDAGFGFGLNVFLKSEKGKLGEYTVDFNMVNNNLDTDTSLSTVYVDGSKIPPEHKMEYASAPKLNGKSFHEKNIGDLVNFIKNLYGNSVDVFMNNGKLAVKDTRSGESKLTLNIKGKNEGIFSNTYGVTMGGNYTGDYDDKWNLRMASKINKDSSRDISITIIDKAGNKIYDEVTKNYIGGKIKLPYGVTLDPSNMGLPPYDNNFETSFGIDLKAGGSLSFGDMNVVDNGNNVNIFRSIKNLKHALEYNITKNGFSAPSAWKDKNLRSSAIPFFDGVFNGKFNDNWTYRVSQTNGKNQMYLQNESNDFSGDIKYKGSMIKNLGGIISFGVDFYDNSTGQSKTINMAVDLNKAYPPIKNSFSLQKYIVKKLNDNENLFSKGIRFSENEGKIRVSSGSGTKIVRFNNNAKGIEKVLTSYVMNFNTVANRALKEPIMINGTAEIQFTDPFASGRDKDSAVKTITVQHGKYTREGLLKAVNDALGASSSGRVKAYFDKNGAVAFSTEEGTIVQVSSMDKDNPLKLGLEGGIDDKIFAFGAQSPSTNMKESSEEARTLNFKYLGGNPSHRETTSITIDKRAYGSIADIASNINEKLLKSGIKDTDIKAVVTSTGELAFTGSGKNFSDIVVEGDYKGSLGYMKAGDTVLVKVTDGGGNAVQSVKLDTAKKSVIIGDGLSLGFDSGSLNSSDSFTGAIGSGVESEIPTLDRALQQVLNSATVVGNLGSRAESVMNFHDTVIRQNEQVKADNLGSTDLDQSKAQTDYALATKAYEAALGVVGKTMSISLLDFLN